MNMEQSSSRDVLIVYALVSAILIRQGPGLEFFLGSPDHGYQLNLGYQITRGAFPYVDLLFHYGPLTAYTSAVGVWLSGDLWGEVLICAAGHAAGVTLIYYLTSRYTSRLSGAAAAFVSILWLTRFYKWYYWLFPLISLYLFHRLLRNREQGKNAGTLFIAGLTSGSAFLYRFDLGLACFCFTMLGAFFLSRQDRSRSNLSLLFTWVFAGVSVPLAVWIGLLVYKGGFPALGNYYYATVLGTKGAVSMLSLPFPTFDRNHPLSVQSGAALAYLLVALTYILGGIVAFLLIFVKRSCEARHVFLLATVTLGIGIMPQALHRSDIHHLRQVLPPAVIAGGLLMSILWQTFHGYRKLIARMVCALFVGILVWTTLAVGKTGGPDLSPWTEPLSERRLTFPDEPQEENEHWAAVLSRKIRDYTSATSRILVLGNAPQIYFFSEQRMAGVIPCYLNGLLAKPEIKERNMESLKAEPPAAVIIQSKQRHGSMDTARYWPELVDFVNRNYPTVRYEIAGWELRQASDKQNPSD